MHELKQRSTRGGERKQKSARAKAAGCASEGSGVCEQRQRGARARAAGCASQGRGVTELKQGSKRTKPKAAKYVGKASENPGQSQPMELSRALAYLEVVEL